MKTSRYERGATLIVGLIMLTVITLMVTAAFSLSNTNLKAVGNMQFRDEAAAAANVAIEQVVTGFMDAAPAVQTIQVDLNNDGNTDYSVVITPSCISSSIQVLGTTPGGNSNVELGLDAIANISYRTLWNIDALVTDTVSGASVRIHHGVRRFLTTNCT